MLMSQSFQFQFMSDSGWSEYSLGNIIHGPGSYYLNDPSITQMFPEITTEMEAWMMENGRCCSLEDG